MMVAHDYRIGDQAEPVSRQPIYIPGEPRWHALMVYPQKEPQARAWLERKGVYSFFPVKTETRHRRGVKTEVERRYLPGYLFARFPGEAVQHIIFASLFIHNGIRYRSGNLGILTEQSIKGLQAMRSREQTLDERERMAKMPKRGDRIRVRLGQTDIETEVREITAGGVTIQISLLGERMIDVPFSRVEKIG